MQKAEWDYGWGAVMAALVVAVVLSAGVSVAQFYGLYLPDIKCETDFNLNQLKIVYVRPFVVVYLVAF